MVPLAQTLVYFFVFKFIFKARTDHYVAYVIMGVLPWAFFSQSMVEGSESLLSNSNLISKIPLPLQTFPFVSWLTNVITLFLGLPVVLAVALASGASIGPSIILLPVLIAMLLLCGYSISLMLSIQSVYMRDLKQMITIIVQLWFYATPVIYDVEMIPNSFQWILYVNPVGSIFIALHDVIPKGSWPDANILMNATAWTLSLTGLALLSLRRHGRFLVEYL